MSGAAVSRGQGSMNPFERVLSKLPEAKPVAGTSHKAWRARCPAHADSDPSLSVMLGDKGGALIHCYAGCAPESIVEALGLTMADLMPPRETQRGHSAFPACPEHPPEKANAPVEKAECPLFPNAEEAVAELERRMGPASQTWVYHDDCEDPAGLILRWDREGGKEIRPVSRTREGWVLGGMPTPRPLYRLVELLKRREERVYVAEGEKAADAAGTLGLLATTSPHGAQSAAKADWRPLAGRNVAILPDNDDAGRRYADDVARILLALEPPATVRIVALPEIEAGEDIYDWLEHRDAVEPHTLRERLEKLVAAAAVCSVPVRTYLPDDPTANKTPEKTTPPGVPTNESLATGPVVLCLDDIRENPVHWLWPGRVGLGRITLLVGRPGEGKSFLTTDMAARVTQGLAWPDGSPCPAGSVLLISAENDPADTIRPRLRAHGADLRRVHLLSVVRRTDSDGRPYDSLFSLADLEDLERAATRCPDCRLIVIDPIGSFLGGEIDAHRENEVRSVLTPVGALAERCGVAILLVAHRRKSPGPNADDMALGSRAFTAVSRSVLHLMRDSQDRSRRLLLAGKNNNAPEAKGLAFAIRSEADGLPRICWESGHVEITADQAMRQENRESSEGDKTAVQRAVTWLQDALADGPVPSADVLTHAKAQGISQRTLERAKESLGVRSDRKSGQGAASWYFELPAVCGTTRQGATP
ncbi:MAG TPA: AAA family ATPase [Sedimentisphaerales bacterium]|nr:AAA family ATPase [Sedimentisphaerales bacterium]